MSTFSVDLIKATSDVPLYIYLTPGRKVIPTTQQELWRAPNNPTANAIAAFDLSAAGGVIALAVTCRVGSSFVGKPLTIQGLLNNIVAVSASVTIPSTAPFVVQNFSRPNARDFPVAYAGAFQWKLTYGTTSITFGTLTILELYTVAKPPAPLWPSFGVSVNLLRKYVPFWNATTSTWPLAAFYNSVAGAIFNSPFKYDNVNGAPRYTSYLGGSYKLDKYFQDLQSGSAVVINCYDMAGIVQVVLSLFPYYGSVRWDFMDPYGYINTMQ
jgi:hypothetical protein